MNEFFKYILKNLKKVSIEILSGLAIIGSTIFLLTIPLLFLIGIMEKEPILCAISVFAGIVVIVVRKLFDLI